MDMDYYYFNNSNYHYLKLILKINYEHKQNLLKKAQVLENNTNVILLTVELNETLIYTNDELIKTPIGYDLVDKKFFRNSPPKENEIEYAINYIEDEIEKIVPKLPKDFILYIDNDFMVDIAKLVGIDFFDILDILDIKTPSLEFLFGKYAEVSQGAVPMPFQKDISSLFYSKLLIIREYTHHLKLQNLKVFNH